MHRNRFNYAPVRPLAVSKKLPQGYVIPAAALAVGILLAMAVVAKTPENAIRGFGDVIVFPDNRESFIYSYWLCARYHIAALLLSTTFLGAGVIPLLLAYKGFTMCCTSAALILDYSFKGALLSSVIIGLPALVSLPCLFVISADAMRASNELLGMRLGRMQRAPRSYDPRRSLICLGILVPVAIMENHMIPQLLEYILN